MMIRAAHMFLALFLMSFLTFPASAKADFLEQNEVHLTCVVDSVNMCREEGCNRFELIQSERYVFQKDQVTICLPQKNELVCEDYVYLNRKDMDPDHITFHAHKSDDSQRWAFIGVNKARNMWKVMTAMPPTDNSIGLLLKRMACTPVTR